MQTYGKYAPTGFDSRGAFLPDQQNWFVAPVIQTRDSGILDKANFQAALDCLGGESETIEVHRFRHWGPGWFEIILVSPDDVARVKELEDLEAALSDYPIVNETLYSRMEADAICECWERMSMRERIELCAREKCSIFAARRNSVPSSDIPGGDHVWERLSVWVNE